MDGVLGCVAWTLQYQLIFTECFLLVRRACHLYYISSLPGSWKVDISVHRLQVVEWSLAGVKGHIANRWKIDIRTRALLWLLLSKKFLLNSIIVIKICSLLFVVTCTFQNIIFVHWNVLRIRRKCLIRRLLLGNRFWQNKRLFFSDSPDWLDSNTESFQGPEFGFMRCWIALNS